MKPEEAVERLAKIVAARTTFTEDELYAAMADANIPPEVADRAYKFTLFAWGRVLLDGIGVHFSPDYFCFDASGEVIESGRLADEPYFATAYRVAGQYAHSKGFGQLALMSSETAVVNDALNSGSRPEDLVLAPAARFVQQPTSAGMEKVRRFLSWRIQRAAEYEAAKAGGIGSDMPRKPKDETTGEASSDKRVRRIKLTKEEKKSWWQFWK